jgi:hypothetical protein
MENKNHKLSSGLTLTPEGMQAFEKSQKKQFLQAVFIDRNTPAGILEKIGNTLITLHKTLYSDGTQNYAVVEQSDNEDFESGNYDIYCNNKIVYHIDYSIESGKLKMEIETI